ALLAQLSDERIATLPLARLEEFTARPVTSRPALLAASRKIRDCHVAVDMGEHGIGISAVATALWGPTGAVQAIAVVVPTTRFKARTALAIQNLRLVSSAVNSSDRAGTVRNRLTFAARSTGVRCAQRVTLPGCAWPEAT
ncbi:MAG TPA: IclR family transcriptional regulator C-terminal domain-containing protein, partial [Streptosporangiaceae bacterium]